jgi:hypothetical protein
MVLPQAAVVVVGRGQGRPWTLAGWQDYGQQLLLLLLLLLLLHCLCALTPAPVCTPELPAERLQQRSLLFLLLLLLLLCPRVEQQVRVQ